MTRRPIVTIISSANPNHPNTIAVTPTPVSTLPFPMVSAIVAAATLAVCCQSTLTSTKIAATNMMASEICETARLGRRRTLGPSGYSSSYPGNVASSNSTTVAKMIATMIKYGNTMLSLNVSATQIKFNGSWLCGICAASELAFAEHSQLPPSAFTQMPKNPTRASSCASPTMLPMAREVEGSTCAVSNSGSVRSYQRLMRNIDGIVTEEEEQPARSMAEMHQAVSMQRQREGKR